MKNFPFYQQIFFIGLLPLFSYGCFTPAERIWIRQNQSEVEKIEDELTMALAGEISKKLDCDDVDAIAIIMAVEQGLTLEKREAAAYKLATLKHRPAPRNPVFEQFTYLINSRLDWASFEKAAFDAKYNTATTNTWTLAHTMAIVADHPAIDAFISNEAGSRDKEPIQELTAGESSLDVEPD